MEPLTGQDAVAALQLYTRLGSGGISFNRSKVAKAVRTVAGRRHLSTVIDRARVVSTIFRPIRFVRERKARVSQRPSRPTGRAPDSSRPRAERGEG